MVTVGDIWQARERIRQYIFRTPLIYSRPLSHILGCSIYLKMECWQVCGCFKIRGASNKIATLTLEERHRGLVTASSGNHAIAVAHAASLFGCPPVSIYMPEGSDPTKVKKVRSYPVDVVLSGNNFIEAYDQASRACTERGAEFVHSHADPAVIAGQGTIGLEILEDLPDVEAVVVPVGGGGLISGISLAVKTSLPPVRIFGAEPASAPSAYLSLRDHRCYDRIEIKPSIADGLLGGIGQLPFEIISRYVDDVLILEEEEIMRGVRAFQNEEQIIVEPASAVGLAAMLCGKLDLREKKVVLVVTSRNIDSDRYNQIIQWGRS